MSCGRTLVKICGITHVEDARGAVEAGADAVGFVFAASPRQVGPAQARAIIRELPAEFVTVGVFVNPQLDEVLRVMEVSGIKSVQLHGDESPEFLARVVEQFPAGARGEHGWPAVVKAFRLRNREELAQLRSYTAAGAFVIDAHGTGLWGGSGKCADWELAREAGGVGRIILAGGLNEANVAEAIAQVRPFGVEGNSGVESAPGKKDPRKVREFIAKVKA